jgi:hypothetical protein
MIMNMLRFKKSLFLIGLIVIVAGMSSCKKDDGPAPTTAKIKGNITLLNTEVWAAWQDSGEVQLTVFPEFSLNPPAGWGPIPDNTFGPGVPGGTFAIGAPANAQNPIIYQYQAGGTIAPFELEVDPGTYSALALGFRHDLVTDPSLRTATLGVYWGNPTSVSHGIVIKVAAGPNIITVFDEPAPSTFTVEAGDELNIDFIADFGIIEDWYMR